MKKRVLSMILCLGMLLASAVIPAQAATTAESANPTQPLEIYSSVDSLYTSGEEVPEDLVPLDSISGDSSESAETKVPTEEEAYQIMIAMKKDFPEGMPYTNADYYAWNGGIYAGGYGCAGFCFRLSDAVFGNAQSYIIREFTYQQIRVGDILRVNNNTHSVTIMEKYSDHVVLAEANYGGTVHWGRTMTRDEVMLKGTYLHSRYPKEGWYKEDGDWYFYKNNVANTGWLWDGKNWFYFDSNGIMQTGWVKVDGAWYYMNSSGAMQTGWVKLCGTWYYMNSKGAMQTGWVRDNGAWYYMDSSGAMQTGWVKVNGIWYYMNGSGVMQTGWVRDSGAWYYMDSSGAMQTGWLDYGNSKYYLLAGGAMATGTQTIDGVTYTFSSSGALIK